MWTKSYHLSPDTYRIRIRDKTNAKAELAELIADYKGTITLCPTETADAPGVPPQQLRQNARRRRLAEEAKRQRLLQNKKRQHRSRL